MITNAERMIKEDMAEYITEELSKFECIPSEKRETAVNVISKALADIQRRNAKEPGKCIERDN